MNAKTITLAIALSLASIASHANPAWPSTDSDFTPSTLTREQVRAELAQAQAAGQLDTARIAYGARSSAAMGSFGDRSRAEVRAELLAARARGELDIAVLAYGAAPMRHSTAPQTTLATEGGTQKSN